MNNYLLFCESCNNLFNPLFIKNKNRYCPICLSSFNKLVEIDDYLAPIIKELNLLGYKTISSCIGHYLDKLNENNNMYIMFNDKYPIIVDIIKSNNYKFIIEYIDNKLIIRSLNYLLGLSNSVEFINELNKLISSLQIIKKNI